MLTTQLKVYVRGRLFEKSRDLLVELDTLGFAKDEVNKAQTDMFMSHQSCIFYLLFFRWKFRVKKLYQQVVFRFNNFQILCFSLVFSSAHLLCNFFCLMKLLIFFFILNPKHSSQKSLIIYGEKFFFRFISKRKIHMLHFKECPCRWCHYLMFLRGY